MKRADPAILQSSAGFACTELTASNVFRFRATGIADKRGLMLQNNASRTQNVTKNLVVGIISKAFLLAATFVTRTLFIRILGAEYTGISSLYSNILSLLNLAELGFGSVLTYELYKPLRDNDEETVTALVALFKKIYSIIIVVVLTFGLLLLPFLKYIVKSDLNQTDLLIYYLLYLTDSVASYFVAYRTMVIEADQKQYVTNLTEIIARFAMYICQSVYLVVARNFLGYLVIQVLFTIIKNVALHLLSLKMYPFLNKKTATQKTLNTGRIYRNAKAMCVTKISGVILNQTDSIIISILLGTIYVGYYSNYYMLIIYLNSIYSIIVTSMEASVGNLNAEENQGKSYSVYKRIDFLLSSINVFCVAEFICIVQNFITVWIGEEYIQGWPLVIALMVAFYLQQSMNTVLIYRQTMGLFEAVKKVYPIMAILNIVLSILFGKIMGAAGVALATGMSRLLTVFWYEGKIVFQKMGQSMWQYLLSQIKRFSFLLITVAVAFRLSLTVSMCTVTGIILKGIITGLVVLICLFIVYHRTAEWKWAVNYAFQKIRRKI